jgi:epoxyqueuosine reductase
MIKNVGHYVKRPGRQLKSPEINIAVAEELETVPGIPLINRDVDFYSREYPLENLAVTNSGDTKWAWSHYSPEIVEIRKQHAELDRPWIEAAAKSGGLEPTAPRVNRDVTEEIKEKARELGFGEVGIVAFDQRYVYASKKSRIRADLPHAICTAMEHDYVTKQTIPSLEADTQRFIEFREKQAPALLELGDFIRALGYPAEVQTATHNNAVYIPMFVEAGLGQLGANGQLLSPHFGSRSMLGIITTDAPVSYDQPVDYGIHAFCQLCQVCINRCPGRALMRDKIWWRGVEKNKLVYKRCRPVFTRYEGCAVCVKVCPIQKYGMHNVMEHFVATGQILGKGSHGLEGYSLPDKGYFGPGELPQFGGDFFDIPNDRVETVLVDDLRAQLENDKSLAGSGVEDVLKEFARNILKASEEEQAYRSSGLEVDEDAPNGEDPVFPF